jgi:VanZ family protein
MAWLRWTCWFLTAAYWGAIFVLTHLPPEEIARAPHFWDKAEHFIAYFLLAVLLGGALMLSFPETRGIPLWVLLIGFAYGVVDELLQPFVRRDAELLDWVADASGVWAAVVVLWAVRRMLFPLPRRPAVPAAPTG